MDGITAFLIIILVVIAIVVAVGVTAFLLISKGVKGLVKASTPKIKAAKRNALKVRAESTPGNLGAVLKHRVALQESLEATGRSLAVAQNSGQYTGNLEGIFRTLQQAGVVMDHHLAVAAQEPDSAVQGLYAKTLGAQVEQITQTATGVRNALAGAAASTNRADMADLTRSLEIEAKMLENWSKTYTDLAGD